MLPAVSMTESKDVVAQSMREQFNTLAREAAPYLVRIARRLCPYDDDTAQDLVQNTLVVAYERLSQGQLEIGPGTQKWLARALTNEFLQRVRKDKRLASEPPEADALTDREAGPHDKLVQQETARLIDDALSQLTPEHRACIVLVDLQDLDYREAAEILEVPLGTVRSRLSRARLRMAEIIQSLQGETP